MILIFDNNNNYKLMIKCKNSIYFDYLQVFPEFL